MNIYENQLYFLEQKIQQLESKLAEKDREYFLIKDHNKKLCDQLAEQEIRIERLVQENWEAWAGFDEKSKLLDEAVDVIVELGSIFEGVKDYEKAREFLAKVKGESNENK